VFAQLYALQEKESQLTQLMDMVSRDIIVTHLTLTIRYTDWWWWERNEPLVFSKRTMGNLRLPSTIQEFNLELETRNGKKAELDALLPQIEMSNIGNYLSDWEKERFGPVPKFLYCGKSESDWITSSRQGMTKPPRDTIPTMLHHYPAANGTPDLAFDKMLLWVVKLKWVQRNQAHND
jgi:hypothetical protein